MLLLDEIPNTHYDANRFLNLDGELGMYFIGFIY